jgi:CarD family transcriptional regulator
MYSCGDRVIYGIHGVCEIVALEDRRIDRKLVQYYVLQPLERSGERFYVPIQNPAAVAKLRPVMTVAELDALLSSDVVRRNGWIEDENARKQRYRELITSGDRGSILCMVCTLHNRKQEQLRLGKKFHLCDENFLRDAQRLLNSEFSLVLGLEANEVVNYIQSKLIG